MGRKRVAFWMPTLQRRSAYRLHGDGVEGKVEGAKIAGRNRPYTKCLVRGEYRRGARRAAQTNRE